VQSKASQADKDTQLSFKKKDVLTLVDKMGNKGWWKAKAPNGKEGLVPGPSFLLSSASLLTPLSQLL
jgi:hypothetical protein